jgi:hypothetical protein
MMMSELGKHALRLGGLRIGMLGVHAPKGAQYLHEWEKGVNLA